MQNEKYEKNLKGIALSRADSQVAKAFQHLPNGVEPEDSGFSTGPDNV
jgi:hypothetical protein